MAKKAQPAVTADQDAPLPVSTTEGLPVAGYQPQSDHRIATVNRNKEYEERLLRLCDELRKDSEFDQWFVNIAVQHFQQGFMALNRAVFQPTRIKLPEDENAKG